MIGVTQVKTLGDGTAGMINGIWYLFKEMKALCYYSVYVLNKMSAFQLMPRKVDVRPVSSAGKNGGKTRFHSFRVTEINNSTIWRRMRVRRQDASAGAYRDMCRRMERR